MWRYHLYLLLNYWYRITNEDCITDYCIDRCRYLQLVFCSRLKVFDFDSHLTNLLGISGTKSLILINGQAQCFCIDCHCGRVHLNSLDIREQSGVILFVTVSLIGKAGGVFVLNEDNSSKQKDYCQ